MKTIKIKIVLILGSKNPLTDLIVQKSLKMMDEIIFLVRTATQTHIKPFILSFLQTLESAQIIARRPLVPSMGKR